MKTYKIWIEWTRKKADWYDPNIEQEDELLGNVDKVYSFFQGIKTSVMVVKLQSI